MGLSIINFKNEINRKYKEKTAKISKSKLTIKNSSAASHSTVRKDIYFCLGADQIKMFNKIRIMDQENDSATQLDHISNRKILRIKRRTKTIQKIQNIVLMYAENNRAAPTLVPKEVTTRTSTTNTSSIESNRNSSDKLNEIGRIKLQQAIFMKKRKATQDTKNSNGLHGSQKRVKLAAHHNVNDYENNRDNSKFDSNLYCDLVISWLL